MERRYKAKSNAIYGLWLSWATSVGAFAIVFFSALFISKQWLPAVLLLYQFLLIARMRLVRAGNKYSCVLMPYVVMLILFFSVVAMVAINLYYLYFVDQSLFDQGVFNRKIPYITVLVMGPITSVITLWAYLRNNSLAICDECKTHFGHPAESGFIGKVFMRESRFQLRMLMLAAMLITVYSWVYYFFFYSNVNFSEADKLFYIWIPIILYIISLLNLGVRYAVIEAFYRRNVAGEVNDLATVTLVRYIIMCGDRVFLDVETNKGYAETPVQTYVPYRERFIDYDAITLFNSTIGSTFRGRIRFLYENANVNIDCNIFHYMCEVSTPAELQGRVKGKWFTQSELRDMIERKRVSPMLISEMDRLYTVTMAYKTYDSAGHRLYDIKHYKPSFRLHDIAELNVDYNDTRWLFVAKDNEDNPFYNFKRFWRRYVRGIYE
jgi:hypothetical protein